MTHQDCVCGKRTATKGRDDIRRKEKQGLQCSLMKVRQIMKEVDAKLERKEEKKLYEDNHPRKDVVKGKRSV